MGGYAEHVLQSRRDLPRFIYNSIAVVHLLWVIYVRVAF